MGEYDTLAKIENELADVRAQIEEVRGIPNFSIGSLTTDDADVYKRLKNEERSLERRAAFLGSTSVSNQTRRNVAATDSSRIY
jgi:hypothetical protein